MGNKLGMNKFSVAMCLLLCVVSDASCQEEDSVSTVKVIANPDKRPFEYFLKGLLSFEKNKALAPNAVVNFSVVEKAHPLSSNVALEDRSTDSASPVAVSSEGIFALSQHLTGASTRREFVSDKKAGSLRWLPNVRTEGLPSHIRRIGDLRAECLMYSDMEYENMSVMVRSVFWMAGGLCNSSKISTSAFAHRRLKSAILYNGEERKRLAVSRDQLEYFTPLYDKSISDEATVVFEYADS